MNVVKFIIILGLLGLNSVLQAQDLEKVLTREYFTSFFSDFKEAKPFDIRGGLSMGMRFYNATGIDNRQTPWLWNLSANTTVSLYKLKLPFSAYITTQAVQFTTPKIRDSFEKRFTRIGVSPYYKWAKLHFGHRTMNFSSFTLAKHTFLGAGIELNPGRLRFAAMYGKLPQTAPRNLSLTNINREVFNRTGWGTKIGYGSQKSFIDLILFKANDASPTASIINQDEQTVFPQENLVIGFNGKTQLFKRVNLYAEMASSAITDNRNDPIIGGTQFPHPSFLLDQRNSTDFNNAINAGLSFQVSRFNVGVDYKRIDPGYKSLGAYFFQDDFENYTANARWSMFKQKMNISVNGGIQRNNLDNAKDRELRRTIGSAIISYIMGDFMVNVNYSNYSSDLSYVLNPELDSLNAIVVTQSSGIMATWTKTYESKESHSLSAGINLQNVSDEVLDPMLTASSQMRTANLNYTYSTGASKWQYKARVNYNQNELTGNKINRIGIGGGIAKSLLDDALKISYDINYFSSNGENFDLTTLNNRLNLRWKVNDSHSMDFNFQVLNRNRKSGSNPINGSEQIGNVRYGYRF